VGAVVATLRAKVAQAEKDAKAYKARIRSVETLERSKADLSDKVEALETRLLASEGAAAAHEATLEEMRRRAVVAEAKAEALKKELKRDIRDVAQERHSQAEILRRVSELEGELQRALLGRATMERRAEVCEAELVESLAKLYTLEREKQGGAAGGAGFGHDAGYAEIRGVTRCGGGLACVGRGDPRGQCGGCCRGGGARDEGLVSGSPAA
jgi:DNA repair exonuclease SbcCD ATPase subunit